VCLGNKQIYNSNCIQQFNYGTRRRVWKKVVSPTHIFFLSFHPPKEEEGEKKTAKINVQNEKSFVVKKDHDEFEAFFNYFHHTSSSVDEKSLEGGRRKAWKILPRCQHTPTASKSLFKDFQQTIRAIYNVRCKLNIFTIINF
jgi:hypothetical protein